VKIGIYEECRNCTKDDRRYGFIPYAAVCRFRRQALFPIQKTAWKAGESELICLHGGLRLRRPYIGRMAAGQQCCRTKGKKL